MNEQITVGEQKEGHINFEVMNPREIVAELDKYIIGQEKAKKIVAIAIRNRVRRSLLPDDIRDEVAPKNIIMIGSTGVGKTEIARRLSNLSGAPFVKVEATKYTEVGYVGRDVESMVRDLMSMSLSMVKDELQEGIEKEAALAAEEALLDLLLPAPNKPAEDETDVNRPVTPTVLANEEGNTNLREKFRKMLREGTLDERSVEIEVNKNVMPTIEVFSNANFEEMGMNIDGMMAGMFGGGKKRRKVTVAQAKEILLAQQKDKLIDNENAAEVARERVENRGIIFIDEIDKIAVKQSRGGGQDVSREGVQRDILPIVEGSKVNTRHGIIDTSHILFIAAGAFNLSKPSDLIPELQGRFPLRVELGSLDASAFKKILTTPRNALIRQYTELLKTEEVELEFTDDAVDAIAEIAADVNARTENIGARRLHTVMENLLEDISFTASERKGEKIVIDAKFVKKELTDIAEDQDLSRYIL